MLDRVGRFGCSVWLLFSGWLCALAQTRFRRSLAHTGRIYISGARQGKMIFRIGKISAKSQQSARHTTMTTVNHGCVAKVKCLFTWYWFHWTRFVVCVPNRLTRWHSYAFNFVHGTFFSFVFFLLRMHLHVVIPLNYVHWASIERDM